MNALLTALSYISRGWSPVPVPLKQKGPTVKGWQNLRLTAADAGRFFNGKAQNVGVILGQASGGLVDADLDCPEAIALSGYFLPPTEAVFGRESKPRSHRLYVAPLPKRIELIDPDNGECLLELRSTGSQTVFPGSVHPSGEPVEWEEDGDPAQVDPGNLLAAARKLGAACLLLRHDPQKGRHYYFRAVSGWLLRSGWKPEAVRHLLTPVARIKLGERTEQAEHEIRRLTEPADGRTFPASRASSSTSASKRARKLAEWLGIRHSKQENGTAPAGEILDPADPYANAQRFLEQRYTGASGLVLRHCQGDFYRHVGTHWATVEDAALRSEAYAYLAAASCITDKGPRPFKPTASRVNDFTDAVRAATHLGAGTAVPGWLPGGAGPPPDELVPLQNGLLHLPSGELLPPTPSFFNTHVLPFAYDSDAGEPKGWLGFLENIWPDDPQTRGCLQETIGYLISGDRRQQKVFLVVGPPRSGKGTIARVIRALVGAENAAGPTLADLANNFGLAPLIGKSIAIISDARLSGKVDAAAVAERLLSISGEDAITVDRKHREHWTGTLPTRFMVLTNELPKIADASGALASRFVVLTMTRSFLGREDHDLTARLLGELSAIFNWAVEGWRRLSKRGRFVMPASSTAAVEDIEALSSPILAFLKACCEIRPGAEVECAKLYARWCGWCEAQGRREPGTTQSFGRDLRAAVPGLKVANLRAGEARTRFYEGVGASWNAVERVPSIARARDATKKRTRKGKGKT